MKINKVSAKEIGTGGAKSGGGIRTGCIKKAFQGMWPVGWVLRYKQEFSRKGGGGTSHAKVQINDS